MTAAHKKDDNLPRALGGAQNHATQLNRPPLATALAVDNALRPVYCSFFLVFLV